MQISLFSHYIAYGEMWRTGLKDLCMEVSSMEQLYTQHLICSHSFILFCVPALQEFPVLLFRHQHYLLLLSEELTGTRA